MENEIQFINDGWRYVKRSVNLNNFTISYTQKGGFASKKEAIKAKEADDAQYDLDLMRIKKSPISSILLKSMLNTGLMKYLSRIQIQVQRRSGSGPFEI